MQTTGEYSVPCHGSSRLIDDMGYSSAVALDDPLAGIHKAALRRWQAQPPLWNGISTLRMDFKVAAAMLVIPRRVVTLTRQPARRTRMLYQDAREAREAFRRTARQKFLKQWINTFGTLNALDDLPDARILWNFYQCHHLQPIAYSGGNGRRNFVALDMMMHGAVHDEIDARTAGMQLGESRDVLIPFPPGPVWIPQIALRRRQLQIL